jgi:hypothetical protein
VVLDPQWFGLNVIGRVLAPDKDDLRQGEAALLDPNNASVSLTAFCRYMTQASEKFAAVPVEHMNQVVEILIELQVCFRVDGSYVGKSAGIEYLVFPSMLPVSRVDHVPDGMWTRVAEGAERFMLGRRLQSDDECYLIPSGLFPKLQVYMRQLYSEPNSNLNLSAIQFWYHGMHMKTHDGLEALIQMSIQDIFSRQYIDILVWTFTPTEGHLGSCKRFLDALIDVCEVQQREHHFGRVALARYIIRCSTLYDEYGGLLSMEQRDATLLEEAMHTQVQTM